MKIGTNDFPRLVIIVDFGVERSTGGQLLLHRLFSHYPADRLLVVYDPGQASGNPSTFLPNVTYCPYPLHIPRFIRNRFNPTWPLWMAAWMRRHTQGICELLNNFSPEAVLTVPHWFLWLGAANVAKRLSLPLHLIIHDDWSCYTTFRRPGRVADAVRWGCRRVMRRVYHQAVSRLCISPGMVEQYRSWFGITGTVLYPSRGDDSPSVRMRVRQVPQAQPVLAYCGNIHLSGTADLLRRMATCLATCQGYLDLYTSATREVLAVHGLDRPNVRLCGFFPAKELGDRVGNTAHALFLPTSFDPSERIDVSTLFPSKLADYTAIGLPILIWGPSYSSAARWANDFPGACVCITDPQESAVSDIVHRFATDPQYGTDLAAAGLAAGSQCFELESARQILYSALRSNNSQGESRAG